jgi:hypothetical protein
MVVAKIVVFRNLECMPLTSSYHNTSGYCTFWQLDEFQLASMSFEMWEQLRLQLKNYNPNKGGQEHSATQS